MSDKFIFLLISILVQIKYIYIDDLNSFVSVFMKDQKL